MNDTEGDRGFVGVVRPRELEPYELILHAHGTNLSTATLDLRWCTAPPCIGKLVVPPGGRAAYRGRAPERGVRLALTVRLGEGDGVTLQFSSGTEVLVRQALLETQQIYYFTCG